MFLRVWSTGTEFGCLNPICFVLVKTDFWPKNMHNSSSTVLISIPEDYVPEVRNQGSDTKIIDLGTKEEAFSSCVPMPCMQPVKILCKR